MTKQRVFQVLAVAGIAAYLASCSFFEADWPAVKDAKERKKAPDFSLKDSSGQLVKLSDYKGKVVLLNFWATWCAPCEVEIPWFIEFEREFKDRDFTVLGVSADEDGWKAVRPYVERQKLNYPVVLVNEEVDKLYGGIEDLPTTFVIDREGRVASSHVGLISKNTYRKEILTLLGSPKDEKNGLVSDNRLPGSPWADLVRPRGTGASH